MVRNRRDRVREGRSPVRKTRRTERGLAGQRGIAMQPEPVGERPLVVDRQLHEQIVRMLPIVNGIAVTDLTGREQVRVAATRYRPRFQAEHRAHADTAAPDRAPQHAHEPINAAGLAAGAMDPA